MKRVHFGLYEHKMEVDRIFVKRYFIVVYDEKDNIILWTNYHKYLNGSNRNNIKSICSNNKDQFTYVTRFLNYVVFEKYHIGKLTDLTVEMGMHFLNDYGLCKLLGDNENTHRQSDTVERCQKAIMHFFISLFRTEKGLKYKESELYTTEKEFSKKKHMMVTKRVPIFKVYYRKIAENMIFRDIPEKAFKIIFDVIKNKYKNILMLVALCAFAGLRPSEACNVLREDSPLCTGIRFEMHNDVVMNIYIDVSHRFNLRSDFVDVGGIKKPRIQKVYHDFLEAFYECYKEYMRFIEGKKYEAQYGALTNNQNGKAYTYRSYYETFKKVVNDCIPVMLNSEDPHVVNYGLILQEKRISPHIFRHWFSAKLAIYGEMEWSLAYWRGDKNLESSIPYIQNKSDLAKLYSSAVDQIFGYKQWEAKMKYGRKDD